MTSLEDLRENVARGATWLDSARPGWQWDIDPASLDLGDGQHCVLGQVGQAIVAEHGATLPQGGCYYAILHGGHGTECLATLRSAVSDKSIDWAVVHGFSASGTHHLYRTLDDLWLAEIKDRVNR